MKTSSFSLKRGFTLLETVIAIGVLAVLLTGFMIVFAPAVEGIRKAMSVQDADRLASTVKQELVTLRPSDSQATGFEKAFEWIKDSNTADVALLVYQYRGSLSQIRSGDGSPEPVENVRKMLPGQDYTVVPMMRRKDDDNFLDDLKAVDGRVFLVKCKQLVFDGGELKLGEEGKIVNPESETEDSSIAATAEDYLGAVIAFSADFYILPSKAEGYFSGKFNTSFGELKNPIFSRNLAVRR